MLIWTCGNVGPSMHRCICYTILHNSRHHAFKMMCFRNKREIKCPMSNPGTPEEDVETTDHRGHEEVRGGYSGYGPRSLGFKED